MRLRFTYTPRTREEALAILSKMFPEDAVKFRRMKFSQLYAIYKSIHYRHQLSREHLCGNREIKNLSHLPVNKKIPAQRKIHTGVVAGTTAHMADFHN